MKNRTLKEMCEKTVKSINEGKLASCPKIAAFQGALYFLNSMGTSQEQREAFDYLIQQMPGYSNEQKS